MLSGKITAVRLKPTECAACRRISRNYMLRHQRTYLAEPVNSRFVRVVNEDGTPPCDGYPLVLPVKRFHCMFEEVNEAS